LADDTVWGGGYPLAELEGSMKRIGIAIAGTALLVLLVAGPASADYPPSSQPPVHTFATQTPTVSTTTTAPTVEGTKTHSPAASDSVLGKTVTKSPGVGGTAFTGSDLVGPLGVGAALLVVGLALLYLGRRRAAANDR
jgi:hypothetical protein